MKYAILCTLIFISLLSACEREVDLEFESLDRRVVVLSNFSPMDSFMRVTVGISQSALTTIDSVKYLDNATVTLTRGEDFLENLQFTTPNDDDIISGIPHHYKTVSFRPVEGETYNLEVDAGVYGEVSAVGGIPNSDADFSASVIGNKLTTANGYTSVDYRIKINIIDPVFEENYYHVNCFQNINLLRTVDVDGDGIADTVRTAITKGPMSISSENDLLELLPYVNNQGVLIRDRNFNGRQQEFVFNSSLNYNQNKEELAKFVIEVRRVEKAYYDYHSALARQRLIQSGFDPISGAVILSTNIENGLGVFSGYSPVIKYYDISED